MNLKKEVKQFIGFSLGPLLSSFIGFMMTPITSWLIVPEEFGRTTIYSLVMMFLSVLMYLGMDDAYIREFNEGKSKKLLFQTAISFPLGASVLGAIGFILFWRKLSYLFFDLSNFTVMVCLSASLPVAVIQRFNLMTLRMQERGAFYSLFSVMEKIVSIPIMIVMLLFYSRSFESVVLSQFIASAIVMTILLFVNKKLWFDSWQLDSALAKKMFSYGAPLMPAALLWYLLYGMDKIALRALADFNQIGLYGAAVKIASVFDIIKNAFNSYWLPLALRWKTENVEKKVFSEVSIAVTASLTVMFCIATALRKILVLILSGVYRESSEIIPFLLIIPVLLIISETTQLGITYSRKSHFQILVGLIGVVVNFFGNILLIPQFGGAGAAMASSVSFFVLFWARTLISRNLWFKFPLQDLSFNTVLMLSMAFFAFFYNNTVIEASIILAALTYNRKTYIRLFYSVAPVIIKSRKR